MVKKEIVEKPIHNLIKNVLLDHKGNMNKITSKEIGEEVGRPSKEDTHSTIRSLILETIHIYQLPIGASGKGYYYLETKEDLMDYKNYLMKKAMQTLERGYAVERYFAKQHNLDPFEFVTEVENDEEEF